MKGRYLVLLCLLLTGPGDGADGKKLPITAELCFHDHAGLWWLIGLPQVGQGEGILLSFDD